MPLTEPNMLTSVDWINIHNWLTLFWIFFPLMIIFAFSMMIAHAVIPSGVMTGHFPPALSMLRIPLTIIGLIAFGVAVVLLVMVAMMTPGMIDNIWGRFYV
ncbi:MAG: hypothetical protein O2909_04700 [Chloroflexi bacterium]|nr:hypothetical protein [Chloroflexota bacterium]PKB58020.1 MAG: hypothetical protein BZY73_00030 [SAR202 cluster bacterium Casp-Chloro-G3]